jgi:hypothetical protein
MTPAVSCTDLKNALIQDLCSETMKSLSVSRDGDGDGDLEKSLESNGSKFVQTENLKLAADGLPLVPQPSCFKDDPLVRILP